MFYNYLNILHMYLQYVSFLVNFCLLCFKQLLYDEVTKVCMYCKCLLIYGITMINKIKTYVNRNYWWKSLDIVTLYNLIKIKIFPNTFKYTNDRMCLKTIVNSSLVLF